MECVCCTMRDDLRTALLELVESGSNIANIDRIIVETTGLANPAPMIETVVAHPILNDRIRINGVLTLVDCINAESGLQIWSRTTLSGASPTSFAT
jgi:G3E family GTPase